MIVIVRRFCVPNGATAELVSGVITILFDLNVKRLSGTLAYIVCACVSNNRKEDSSVEEENKKHSRM